MKSGGGFGVTVGILSTPLWTRARPVGASTWIPTGPGAFSGPSLERASLFAAEASDLVTAAATAVVDDLVGQLAAALAGRDVISQARGILMERHRVPTAEAAATLRRSSRQAGTTLRQHAEDIVASTQPQAGGSVT